MRAFYPRGAGGSKRKDGLPALLIEPRGGLLLVRTRSGRVHEDVRVEENHR
jgi:hypothetical protein